MRFYCLSILIITAGIQSVWAACDDNLPATGSRNDVLIIINDSAKDSCEVGRYYAEKRQLGKSNIVHIKSPSTPSIGYDQYEILRNQIIKALQQKLAASGVQPVSCQSQSTYFCPEVISQIKAASTIRYLAFTKGTPARVINNSASWPSPSNEAISLDGFIRRQLGDFLYPARIDGLDTAAAKRLIDRALDVEKSGFFGNLVSAATKEDAGAGPGGSRFAKTGYHPVTTTKVESELLTASFQEDAGGSFAAAVNGYPLEGHHHWRYQFGLFAETDTDCTGNSTNAGYYLSKSQSTGKAPEKCKVKLVKGNGANPAYNEITPGISSGRLPTVNNAIAYLGHLDNQPTLSGDFNNIKNWKKTSQCTAQLCKDATDVAACQNASTDIYKELDTRCIGVSEGFIGHNFQSYPVSFFTSWPTGWRPLFRPSSPSISFGGEYGGGRGFTSYPLVKNDDGDGDSRSLWFGAHDKAAGALCYQNDLNTLATCSDVNNFEFGQVISPFSATPIDAPKYYRISLSYRSESGDTSLPATLRATISVQDPNLTITNADGTYPNNNQVPLRWMDSKNSYSITTSTNGVFRDSTNNDAAIGNNSGEWKRVSAVFALDPGALAGSNKQINGLSLILFSSNNFSGSVGIDNIALEEVDSNRNLIAQLPVTNHNLQDGYRQFSTGDWASTFTSRLNAAAFWGSTTHNGGGTGVFTQLTDSLASFIAGDPIAKAVWQNEIGGSTTTNRTGGLLYGDPLYSPLGVSIRPNVGAASEAALNAGQLPIVVDAMNGTDANQTSTVYRIDVCHASATNPYADFYVCDREPNSWISTGISGGSGRNISKTLDASQYAKTIHTLRITATTTRLATGQNQSFQNFFTFVGIGRFKDGTGNYDTDSDGVSDEREVYAHQSDPTKADTDGDGLTDGEEINTYQTSVLKADTDADGLSDGDEVLIHHTSALLKDSDGDDLSDADEIRIHNTDPLNADTDGDNYPDGWEIHDGTDPKDATKFKIRQITPNLWQEMVN